MAASLASPIVAGGGDGGMKSSLLLDDEELTKNCWRGDADVGAGSSVEFAAGE